MARTERKETKNDRHISRTGRTDVQRKGGAGARSWGTTKDDMDELNIQPGIVMSDKDLTEAVSSPKGQ